jgi:hypothetical protein
LLLLFPFAFAIPPEKCNKHTGAQVEPTRERMLGDGSNDRILPAVAEIQVLRARGDT